MDIIIRTQYEFEAAHFLPNYKGKCSNLHGHNWKVVVKVKGDRRLKDKNGILWDFSNLKLLINMLDHGVILNNNKNDKERDLVKYLTKYNMKYVLLNAEVSAENIAMYIWKNLKSSYNNLKFSVVVYENKKSYAKVGDINV